MPLTVIKSEDEYLNAVRPLSCHTLPASKS